MLAFSIAITAAAPGSEMTAPLWRGVDTIVIDCAGDAQLCRAAVAEASREAPLPVAAQDTSSAPDAVGTLILALRLVADGHNPSIEISARRAVVIDESQSELLPKRFTLPADGGSHDLAAVLRLAMDRTLPWRSGLKTKT